MYTNYEGTPIDTNLFDSGMNANPNEFIVMQQSDEDTIGFYPFKFTAWFSDAPSNKIESEKFEVEIIGDQSCDSPMLVAPQLMDQVYKIGD